MRILSFVLVLSVCIITGCSAMKGDYMREDLRQQLGANKPVYDNKDIEMAFKKKVNLPKPFRMAVYFKPLISKESERDVRWTMEDKESFIKNLRESVHPDVAAKIHLIPDNMSEASDLSSIRMAAARFQADAVMIVEGKGEVLRTPNKWAPTYALILPMFFVKGSSMDSFFAVNASLWDVRNELLYASTNAEGDMKQNYATGWDENNAHYLTQTKQVAMTNLQKVIKEDLQSLR